MAKKDVDHGVKYINRQPYCPRCHKDRGEYPWPCKLEASLLSPFEQRRFYEKHKICGRCGQDPSATKGKRSLCTCKACGCLHLHTAPEENEDQVQLFDLDLPEPKQNGPQR